MSSRARNKLTVKQVANAKLGLHSDGGGLYLRVRDSGRSWFFIGTLKLKDSKKGQRVELGLGPAADVTVADARDKAEAFRKSLLSGVDPRVKHQTPAEEPKLTFGEYAMKYLDHLEGSFRNRKHRQQWRNTLKTYAEPIFKLPINEVATSHLVDILQPIWRTKPETASRVRGRIERVLDAAKVVGHRSGENPARWRGHLDKVLSKRKSKSEVKHHAALPFADVAAFMVELRKRPATAARALELVILTAARSGEVRGMTWAEVDFDKSLWTVPKVRMKAKASHQVPLSDSAVAVLKCIRREKDTPEDYVFKAPRGGSLSDMALSQLLKRMGRPDITVHGFRSTFRDWAGEETEFARETVEMALAHTLASTTEAAYRRGRALEKRRPLMTAWAGCCDGKTADDTPATKWAAGPDEGGSQALPPAH